ncbi:MAG: hypothetical protein F4047_08325 [Caldilineaceae bacterium SB0670_bin_27]|uniref:Uncharacterized protein n=1 Tax=Caldilineaceae bacterium SB0664_bin_27 TaxID=2605260 RepID=A0A6B0Z1J7_9CHLR|nr:hypothetical protein [Caldilineaceae bacterium SB0664_bin_27]MYJ78138.1 hypothetical protein [Caldilineaceae bacterium SB0670_bin_27]
MMIDALPRLKGRLRPIRDAHDRNYLYTPLIAMNRSLPLLVSFIFRIDLRRAADNEILARIFDIAGRPALV